MGLGSWLFGGDNTANLNRDTVDVRESQNDLRGKLGNMYAGRTPQLDQTQQLQARGQQQDLATLLQGIASGNQVGAGEMAVNRQVGQGQASLIAGASTQRGANAALAQRQAARTGADLAVSGAGQAAQAQMGDQQMATNNLSGLLTGMRGADIGVASTNLSAQQEQDRIRLASLAQLLGINEQRLQYELAKTGAKTADNGHMGALLVAAGQIAAAKAGAPSGG